MTALKLVGLAGSFNRPSKTLSLVQHIADRAAVDYGFSVDLYDLHDVGPSLGQALWCNQLDDQARGIIEKIVGADVLIVGNQPGFVRRRVGRSRRKHPAPERRRQLQTLPESRAATMM